MGEEGMGLTRQWNRSGVLWLMVGCCWGITSPAAALEVFATSFFPAAAGDPDPTLTGVIKIDLATGVAVPFIAESAGGLTKPSDVVVKGNTLYVSSQEGRIWHYDAVSGLPLSSLVLGEPAGVFALLPTVGFGDGFNAMLLEGDTLLTATAFGSITPFDLTTGTQQTDIAASLSFPSGLSRSPSGELIVATGDPFGGPGELVSIDNGTVTTLVALDASPGIRGASNPTVVASQGDYTHDGLVDVADYNEWVAAFGGSTADGNGDGNGDGTVDAADYTVWRDTQGDASRIIVADLYNNQLVDFALDGTDGALLAVVPPSIPDPLPPTAHPTLPSNSPSGLLVTEQGTLLVSLLGLTQRPDNRGALLEFSRDGTLLQTIASDLPPLSGIAYVPVPTGTGTSTEVPEPGALTLVLLMSGGLIARKRGTR